MKKQLLSLVLVIVLALTFTACEDDLAPDSTSNTTAVTTAAATTAQGTTEVTTTSDPSVARSGLFSQRTVYLAGIGRSRGSNLRTLDPQRRWQLYGQKFEFSY